MRYLFSTLLLLIALNSQAQVKSGIVIYDEVYTFNYDDTEGPEGMEGFDWEEFKSSLPEKEVLKKQLLFTIEHSLCTYLPASQQPEGEIPGGMPSEDLDDLEGGYFDELPRTKYYIDHQTKEQITQAVEFDRTFLITEPDEVLQWKITGKQKKILGYPCMQAITQDSVPKIAWFTTAIPISTGPQGIAGLPGVILELSMHDGDLVFIASEIKVDLTEEFVIEKPSEGKKMPRKKYVKLIEAKYEEMDNLYRFDLDN